MEFDTEKMSFTVLTQTLPYDESKKFDCGICNKRLSSKKALGRHKKIHTGIKPFICEYCEKSFTRKDSLRSHRMIHFNERFFSCDECSKTFTLASRVKRHKKKVHSSEQKIKVNEEKTKKKYSCEQKNKFYERKDEKKHIPEETIEPEQQKTKKKFTLKRETEPKEKIEIKECKPKSEKENSEPMKEESDLCLYDTYKTMTHHHKRRDIFGVTSITFESRVEDLTLFFKNLKLDFYNELFFQLLDKKKYQWYIIVTATLVRNNPEGYSDYLIPHLRSNVITQLSDDNLLENIEEVFQKIKKGFEDFNVWTFLNVNFLELNLNKI